MATYNGVWLEISSNNIISAGAPVVTESSVNGDTVSVAFKPAPTTANTAAVTGYTVKCESSDAVTASSPAATPGKKSFLFLNLTNVLSPVWILSLRMAQKCLLSAHINMIIASICS